MKSMLLLDKFELVKGNNSEPELIGLGSYGDVRLAINKETQKHVAVKIIHRISKNEVLLHEALKHPNIIKLIDHFIDVEKQITYMVLEYAEGGSLLSKLERRILSPKEIKCYFRDICQAVIYLHDNHIIHRDIKPENILLSESGRAKLCDFGFATTESESSSLCGTFEYMSPEMTQARMYDEKVDIWALGILLFELIEGRPPFKGKSPAEVLEQMKTKIYFSEKFHQEEISLIKFILRVSPLKRPSAREILQHPYFNYEDDAISTKESETEVKFLNILKKEANLKRTFKTPSFILNLKTFENIFIKQKRSPQKKIERNLPKLFFNLSARPLSDIPKQYSVNISYSSSNANILDKSKGFASRGCNRAISSFNTNSSLDDFHHL